MLGRARMAWQPPEGQARGRRHACGLGPVCEQRGPVARAARSRGKSGEEDGAATISISRGVLSSFPACNPDAAKRLKP
jgi:hypothetical protein